MGSDGGTGVLEGETIVVGSPKSNFREDEGVSDKVDTLVSSPGLKHIVEL